MKNIFTLCLLISFGLIVNCLKAQTLITFYTTKGNFVVKMEDTKRPITTTNFINLVQAKFYDKLILNDYKISKAKLFNISQTTNKTHFFCECEHIYFKNILIKMINKYIKNISNLKINENNKIDLNMQFICD